MNPSYTVLKNLSLIDGFGPHTSLKFLASIGISANSKFCDLSPFKQDLFYHSLAALKKTSSCSSLNNHTCSISIDKLLSKQHQDNISRLKSNLSYRGARLQFGYPVNGGRTRSNAKTAKSIKS